MNKAILTIGLLSLPLITYAHGSHGSGFSAGFTHPIFGVDHNLAILGTAVLGYILDKKKWYLYSSAFVVMMVIGGLLGIDNEATVVIEKIIVGSVLTIGVVLGLNLQLHKSIILVAFALFGAVHGYAHGAEMPETTTAFKYISGYVVGALVLSITGWIIGKLIDRKIAAIQYQILVGGVLIGAALMMYIG